MPYVSLDTVSLLLPEIILAATATLILMLGAFFPGRGLWNWLAGAGLAVAALALTQTSGVASGPLAADAFSLYWRWLVLLVGLLMILMTGQAGRGLLGPEVVASLLIALVGVMLVSASRDLVMIFLGLELVSLPSYVLLYVGRQNASAQESTIKYFALSIFASAIMLYGFSMLYGLAGSTSLPEIYAVLTAAPAEQGAWRGLGPLALVMVFAGLGFKISAVPFHMYAPDVYQGSTNLVATLLSIAPKVAGFAALVRILVVAMPGFELFGWRMALVLAMLTMTVGNVVALWQTNLRRLMAYSSVAHAGYMLIGLAVAFAAGGYGQPAEGFDPVGAILLYMAVYSISTIGTFAAWSYLSSPSREVETLHDLRGLVWTRPIAASAIALFMLSLAGIPPLAGFWGKLLIFGAALTVDGGEQGLSPVRGWFIALAIIGVLNAAIAAGYYLRVIATMFFGARPEHEEPLTAEGGFGPLLATVLSASMVVAMPLVLGPLWQTSTAAGRTVRNVELPATAVETRTADAVPAQVTDEVSTALDGDDASPREAAAPRGISRSSQAPQPALVSNSR